MKIFEVFNKQTQEVEKVGNRQVCNNYINQVNSSNLELRVQTENIAERRTTAFENPKVIINPNHKRSLYARLFKK